jgi:ATP-dependent Clp protease ATP-binding subunit ClpA
MPRNADFKRLVRQRMRKTGEAYTTARAHLARRQANAGGTAMEPFDRFTRHARQALAAAHAEASGSGADIGAEHLLLGLLRVEDGMAAKVLEQLGVDRRALGGGLRAERASTAAAARLTAEARRALELAIREAAGLGHGFVGTEHLLLGILGEGASTARLALADAGVDLDRTRDRVRREPPTVGAGRRADAWQPQPADDLPSLLERFGRERLTGALRLRRPETGTATLYFLFGHLFHAVGGDAVGDEAVLSALAWARGEFLAEFDHSSRLPADGTVRATILELIERGRTNLTE